MNVNELAAAARAVEHSHKGMDHPQEGNPFYRWTDDCRFRCPLCLALMKLDGTDIALAFIQQLPWRIERRNLHFRPHTAFWDYEAEWWKHTYVTVLPHLAEDWERGYVREQLANALSRGREALEVIV